MKNKLFLITSLLIINGSLISQVPSYVPSEGLVGWWPFNGNAEDESDYTNDGTVYGATLSQDRFGENNKSYNFDGINDFIQTEYEGISNQESRSISLWFKQDSLFSDSYNTAKMVIMSYGNAYIGGDFTLLVNSWDNPNNFGVDVLFSTISYCYVDMDMWHNVIVTYDSEWGDDVSSLKVYFDGQLESSTFFFNENVTINTGIGNFLKFGGGNNYPFYGDIDDIGMWNRVLTDKEIDDLYRSVDTNATTDVNNNSYPVDFGGKVECYPNPTTDVINVDLSGLNYYSGQKLRIMNLSGQIVYEENVNQSKVVIDVKSLLSSGIYVLNTVDRNGTTTSTNKFVVQ
jgi:hypothetical protein